MKSHAWTITIVAAALAVSPGVPVNASTAARPASVAANSPEYEVVVNGITYDAENLADPSCAAGDAELKHVVAYQRRRPDGVAVIYCGNATGFGWRHIVAEHSSDWNNIVTKYGLGGTWQQFALWAISGTVGQPASAPHDGGNDTYRYTAVVQIKDYQSKAIARTYTVTVPVGAKNDRVITAFPRS
jgi:hypothetical protein